MPVMKKKALSEKMESARQAMVREAGSVSGWARQIGVPPQAVYDYMHGQTSGHRGRSSLVAFKMQNLLHPPG